MEPPYPRVTILLLTYEDGARKTAAPTLRAALDNILYPGELSVHIADDGSQPGHVDALRELAGGYSHIKTIGSTDAARRGYGASYNLATQRIHPSTEVVLVLEDDWELSRHLELAPLVETLWFSREPEIHTIRLGYIGMTQPLWCEVVNTAGGKMIYFDPDSPEPHVSAGHPRLETVTQQKKIGPWAEGLAPGATEFEWCRRREARTGIAWPLDIGPASQRSDSLFRHTGAHGLGEVQPEG